jgi:hypothetical protein
MRFPIFWASSELDVALIFVTVADDERVALALNGDHGMQFRLGAGFKTEVELAAMADNLFHYRLHLVHLDRIDDKVLALCSRILPLPSENSWLSSRYGCRGYQGSATARAA